MQCINLIYFYNFLFIIIKIMTDPRLVYLKFIALGLVVLIAILVLIAQFTETQVPYISAFLGKQISQPELPDNPPDITEKPAENVVTEPSDNTTVTEPTTISIPGFVNDVSGTTMKPGPCSTKVCRFGYKDKPDKENIIYTNGFNWTLQCCDYATCDHNVVCHGSDWELYEDAATRIGSSPAQCCKYVGPPIEFVKPCDQICFHMPTVDWSIKCKNPACIGCKQCT